MREREPGGRLRVVIAGNIYARRALVRRFLEDDGFDVAGEALSRDELLALGGLPRADAVVVDADLLDGTVEALRDAAPDAAIVVFTSTAGDTSPPGADGYLEKGMGLASLTALLHSLLSESPATPVGSWSTPPPPLAPPPERRVLAGLAGVAAGVVLVAVVALAVFGGVGTAPISNPIALPASSPTPGSPLGPSALDLATADLHELRDALGAGRFIEARYVLRDLNTILNAAHPTFATGAFLASAANTLRPFLGGLSPTLLADLKAVFGSALQIPTVSVSGRTTVTEITAGSTTTSSGTTSGGTATGGGSGTGGSGAGGSGGGGSGGGGSGGSGGGGEPVASHGKGHHYGWINKPPAGGWHGTKPHPTHDAPGDGTAEPRGGDDAGTHGGRVIERANARRWA